MVTGQDPGAIPMVEHLFDRVAEHAELAVAAVKLTDHFTAANEAHQALHHARRLNRLDRAVLDGHDLGPTADNLARLAGMLLHSSAGIATRAWDPVVPRSYNGPLDPDNVMQALMFLSQLAAMEALELYQPGAVAQSLVPAADALVGPEATLWHMRRVVAMVPAMEKHLWIALKGLALLVFHQDQPRARMLDAEADEISRRRLDAQK
jgi:hypothetical protein